MLANETAFHPFGYWVVISNSGGEGGKGKGGRGKGKGKGKGKTFHTNNHIISLHTSAFHPRPQKNPLLFPPSFLRAEGVR